MSRHHNRSIKPQTTPVDLLRPSAHKAAGKRTNELLDRHHCVLVQGLSESNAFTPKESMSADLDMLQNLLNKMLNSTESVTIRAAFRIGKKMSEQSETVRPRPLENVLGSKEETSLLLSSGASETPRIHDGAEEETCSRREQLGNFQGTSDTEECDVALEPASHHDGGSNIILASPRQTERNTLFPTNQKRPNPVQKISPDADGAQFGKKTLVRDSVKSFAEIDVYNIDLKTLF
nr:unnamed protein product [Spirometra erinaceieuropaei]